MVTQSGGICSIPAMIPEIQKCYSWFSQGNVSGTPSQISQTRDVFEARSDHFLNDLSRQKILGLEFAHLLVSVIKEVGNNCFDHNLGQWQDIPGCWFEYGLQENHIWVVISDRGQGVFSSLKRILPELNSDQQAIETAFTKRISGRKPERRGNGLKFVRNIINGGENRGLLFLSGSGKMCLGRLASETSKLVDLSAQPSQNRGTFSLILWEKDQ